MYDWGTLLHTGCVGLEKVITKDVYSVMCVQTSAQGFKLNQICSTIHNNKQTCADTLTWVDCNLVQILRLMGKSNAILRSNVILTPGSL